MDRMREPPSVGMQAYVRHRVKPFEAVLDRIPLHRDWYGLVSLPIGRSNYYDLNNYTAKELKHLREIIARLNRTYRVKFHSIKSKSTLEVSRVA